MRVVITGGAGFVGRAVVRVLRERGVEVVALVRDPRRASFLADLGAELVQDDLSDVARLTAILRGADGVIHSAGSYRVGIPNSEHEAMWDANVGATTRVLDAAGAAGTPRIVHVSTVNVFGNTRGAIVDETHRRDLGAGFVSWYDETKYRAHEVAEARIAAGAPIVIVQPSQVYGPGDHSGIGEQLQLANAGKLAYRAFDGFGIGFVHVDDLAAGIAAAFDRGRIGESFVLSGPSSTLRDAIALAARLGGHRSPRVAIPDRLVRRLAPFARLMGQPNLAEIARASIGVTYLASSAKEERELGFHARDLESGFRDVFGGARSPVRA